MVILHLTDFHFSSQKPYKFDQKNTASLIEQYLQSLSQKIDFLVFSGDLVYSGDNCDEFLEADKCLIEPLMEKLGLNRTQVLICPGNHDVTWGLDSDAVRSFIEQMANNESLNQWVGKRNGDFKLSVKHLDSYYEYINSKYGPDWKAANDEVDILQTSHIRIVGGKKIGFCSLNTAWRSVQYDKVANPEGERGRLIVPVSVVKTGLDHVAGCDFKLCIMHHPINFLRGFNEWEVKDLIYREFNVVLYGHEHKALIGKSYTDKDGILTISGAATLASSDSEIGFSIIDISEDFSGLSLKSIILDRKSGQFHQPFDTKRIRIPLPKDKVRINRIRQRIREKFKNVCEDANILFVSTFGDQARKNFIELFSDPVISNQMQYAELLSLNRSVRNLTFQDIISEDKDILISGSDKCGKTSLLKRIQIELLMNFESNGVLPFYVDGKDLRSKDKPQPLIREFRNYYQISKADHKHLERAGYKVVILIDNLDFQEPRIEASIRDFLKDAPSSRIISTLNSLQIVGVENETFAGKKLELLYIHSISKRHIRQLTNKWPNISEDRKSDIVDKIHRLAKQMAIPFNYWTVSLFLWIFETTSEGNFRSDVGLIELYIEKLLDREALSMDRSRAFGFEKYRKFLADLAFELYTRHSQSNYEFSHSDLYRFTESQIESNIRNVHNPNDLVGYLMKRGIIHEKRNGRIGFRLNGVFEYFLAIQLRQNQEFRKSILEDREMIPSFRNELEYYAGFCRDDEQYLRRIYDHSRDIFDPLMDRWLPEMNPDKALVSLLVNSDVYFDKLAENLSLPATPIPQSEVDMIQEEFELDLHVDNPESEPKIKTRTIVNPEQFRDQEIFLHLACRVLRNQDEIINQDLPSEILDYMLNAGVVLGLSLCNELDSEISKMREDRNHSKTLAGLLDMIAKLVPMFVSTILFDGLGHPTMDKLIRSKIEMYKQNLDGNQFRLYILYSLLIDLNPSKSIALLDELIPLMKIKALETTLLYKIQFLIALKSENQPELEQELQKRIRIVAKSINPMINTDKIIEQIRRSKLISKSNDES